MSGKDDIPLIEKEINVQNDYKNHLNDDIESKNENINMSFNQRMKTTWT